MEQTLDQLITTRWNAAKAERNRRVREDRHIARYIRPEHSEWFTEGRNTNRRPAIELLWDDTPIQACGTWARGVSSMTHNQAVDWFTYKDRDKALNNDQEVATWYGMVNEDLVSELKASGFYAAALHRLKDFSAYGYGALYSYEDDNAGHMAFEYVPAPECHFRLKRNGLCAEFMRPLNLTTMELQERGIPIEKCAQNVQDAHRLKKHDDRFLFIHYVAAREDVPGAQSNHDFVGLYFESATGKVIDTHGFHDMPYHVVALDPVPQSSYRIGIGYTILPEIRNLNAQRKKFDRILDNESDSPILTANQDEGREQQRYQPGEMIYQGMDGQGRRLLDPLYQAATGSRVLREENMDSRNKVLEAFHNNLMLMIANGQMTATEVISRDEKIIQAMGPFIIPLMADLETCLDRVFHARMRAGFYDPLPRAFTAETRMQVEFHGILAKAHKKQTALNIALFYTEALGTVGQVDPTAVQRLNHNAALRHMGEARALPPGIVPTEDEIQAAAENDEQAERTQAMLAAMPELAKAAKDGASAARDINEGGLGQGVQLAP